ncbi:MAG: aconitate hydratase [Calditrichaeota bacterium]|nr:aconitate hydratase [Calditrichota bacterium]MCB9369632.1 aconitate hydratase [Calditrichota bacterium]
MIRVESTPEFVAEAYRKMDERISVVRKRLGRPLTLAEKHIFGHLDDPHTEDLHPGRSYLQLRPDRVAMQDATAQMALLQFMSAGLKSVAVPSTVHCDHLIQARVGASDDLQNAIVTNKEVYDFLKSVSQKYNIGFWKPGAGIIHQVVLEQYAFPGGMMIGTDSHTPNAGGLAMFASGVGGADAVDVMAGLPWEVLFPQRIGVHLKGKMNGWASPKDIILVVLGILTVKGGTNAVIEYFGEGAASISATGKGTICNMGAELGATTSVFPYDAPMERYLRATDRGALADLANANKHLVTLDEEVYKSPEKYFDRVIEIDLSTLEPFVVGPHSPDAARPISQLKAAAKENGWPLKLTNALIGSCTNSSYEDICRAAEIADQAAAKESKSPIPLYVTPGSEQVFRTIKRDGQMQRLEKIGATVLANACGPCIGQWKRDDMDTSEANSIMSSYNRNFPGRNDGSPNTLSFLTSPEITVAYALAGTLDFDPLNDVVPGLGTKLTPPTPAPDLPPKGYIRDTEGYLAPATGDVNVIVDPKSERLQILTPFEAWNGKDYVDLPLLLKAKGKCTTDHISPAGKWLKFRGHLDNISNNMFSGAINAFDGERGTITHPLTGAKKIETSKAARDIKAAGTKWIVVGDENYGEGSSREHAAMSPRLLGCAAVITRSFARIHQSNLKKQGILPLTFQNPADYEKIQEGDKISLLELSELAPGKAVKMIAKHTDGSSDTFMLDHTLNPEQIAWFKAGSALNLLREKAK